MTPTNLYWVDGPWPGRLAIAARPRGEEWLEDEIGKWRERGVKTIVSLLTADEEQELRLANEATAAKAHGMSFMAFPIQDRKVPDSETSLRRILEQIDRELLVGKNVVVHCRQGIGRAGLVVACLLLLKGIDTETALNRLTTARGLPLPETQEQRRWIEHYAATLAAAK